MPHTPWSVAIQDRSSIGEARRYAVQVAQSIGFDESRRNDIAIAATESATNVLLHAKSGELLICPFVGEDAVWLDLLALDAGPGIRDIERAMEDGFSTVGTAGQGLGAIERLADESSLYSIPEKGTVYWSRFMKGRPTSSLPLGAVSIPIRGETVCGDNYLAIPGSTRSLYMVVDGLGHGAGAEEAAAEAVTTASRFREETPSQIIARSHDALKKTRGAAMSIAVVDHDRRIVTYAGVGNISAFLAAPSATRSFISQNGTLGAVIPRSIQDSTCPMGPNSTLVMFSDGLTARASLGAYPGIQNRPSALAAGLLYRDFSRRRDDATVLVVSVRGGHG